MSSADHVYQTVRARLLMHAFEPGERLKETALAAELGVSRTPLRQALHRLVGEGWLEKAPNQSVRVKQWTVKDIEDIFDLRQLLEPHAASEAALRRGASHLEQLQQAAEDVEECGYATDEQTILRRSEANARFHHAILDAAGNARLTAVLAGLAQYSVVAWTYRNFSHPDISRSSAHHFEILEAIRGGDAAWARAVMTAHIAAARQAVLKRISDLPASIHTHAKEHNEPEENA